MLLMLWLLLGVVESTTKRKLEVLYHKDFWVASTYFYNDVTFQFNKEVDYYKNKKMEVYISDSLVAYSKEYSEGMDISRYIEGGVDYVELWDETMDDVRTGKCCSGV